MMRCCSRGRGIVGGCSAIYQGGGGGGPWDVLTPAGGGGICCWCPTITYGEGVEGAGEPR